MGPKSRRDAPSDVRHTRGAPVFGPKTYTLGNPAEFPFADPAQALGILFTSDSNARQSGTGTSAPVHVKRRWPVRRPVDGAASPKRKSGIVPRNSPNPPRNVSAPSSSLSPLAA